MRKVTFGKRVRQKRMAKQITLRKFAGMIGVSPTYISQIEQDKLKPPAEDKIIEIAKVLGENEDEMLASAGRISSNVSNAIQQNPQLAATFLKFVEDAMKEDQKKWIKMLEKEIEKRCK